MAGYGDNYDYNYGNMPMNFKYIELITSQYQTSTKFLAMVEACLQKVNDAYAIADIMATQYFDIDSAEGIQLDIIGEIVGQKRAVNFQPSGGLSSILTDNDYRVLLKAKIIKNSFDGKVGYLYIAWQKLFPGGKILINDSQNMSAVITILGTFNSIIEDLINNDYIIPRPQGVLYSFGFGDLPFFGFDRDDAYISGFDIGNIT